MPAFYYFRLREEPRGSALKSFVTEPSHSVREQGADMTAKGALVSSMTLLSRISGFARDVLLSHFLGASGTADAFFVAFRIPNFFRRLFAEGAFSQAFVPVLARCKAQGMAELKQFIAFAGGNFGLALLAVVLVGMAFCEALVALFAPGFWDDAEQFQLTADLLRITFPYLGFIALTAFAGAILNMHDRYAPPAFTPVLLNAALIGAMILAALAGADMAFALAWGVFAAGALQLLFQAPFLARLHLLTWPRVGIRHEPVRQVGRLLAPAALAASASQVNALINTMLASTLTVGSISWLYYADRLLELPIGLVAVALGTVLLPNLSRLAGQGDGPSFARTLGWGLRMGLLLGLPAAVALHLLAEPLIATIFHHGRMRAADVAMSALALQAFAIGLLPLVLVKVLAPAFFAHEDTRTPLRFAAWSVAANIGLSLSMFRWFGHVGLALAMAIAAWLHGFLLWRGARDRGYFSTTRELAQAGLRALAGALCMGLTLIAIAPGEGFWLSASTLARALWLGLMVAAGGGVYVAALLTFGLRPAHLRHRA